MLETIVMVAGYVGMVLILLTLLLAHKHYTESQVISLIGGILLTSNAYANGPSAYPFLVLNGIWTIISVYNLWKVRREKLVNKSKA